MANDNTFNNNPFRNLDSSRFPKKTGKKYPEKNKPEDETLARENSLFLEAMRTNFKTPEKSRKSGFLLSEQCSLPEMKKKKKKIPIPPEQPVKKPEETNEFLDAMRNVSPIGGKGREIAPAPVNLQAAFNPETPFEELLAENLSFSVSFSDEYLEGKVAGLDELVMNRLRQGQLSPEAHLDLHGLNANQAFESLRIFLRSSWYKGMRTILLVPGRGRNSPDGMGILRRKLQSWLTQEPFKRVVLAFCTAQPHDGGPGSIYVLLRRFRKKGRICWERLPADADLY